jgi:hypothetical protein
MSKYRQKMAKGATSSNRSPSVLPTSAPKAQYWEDLTSAYGLDNMDTDDTAGEAGQAEQTVLQEYHAYVKALLSAKGTDLVKFWVVSNLHIACTCDLLVPYYR